MIHHHLLDSTRAGYAGYIKILELCATAIKTSHSAQRVWFEEIRFTIPSNDKPPRRVEFSTVSSTRRLGFLYGIYQSYKAMCQYFESHKETQHRVKRSRLGYLIVQPSKLVHGIRHPSSLLTMTYPPPAYTLHMPKL